ncbi:hypothetical protein KP509_17G057200 [Ceratopteris richardii]|uniref:Gnk2-homologous domain-containing protein n=1 Tax=Ceratopteris richardii TaxID=49495 RepID=A0A8T2SYH4_CERRI|nr:hypothetical protein KP509_17G057200 [Ceratopteris richardii]
MAAHLLRFFFFFSFLFCTLPQPSLQILPSDFPSLTYQDCFPNRSFSVASATYSSNVVTVLGTLSSRALQGIKYSETSVSTFDYSATYAVYAVFQCRGDLTAQSCYVCVKSAAQQMDACSKSMAARVQMDGCFLHYEHGPIFSLDLNYITKRCDPQETSDVTYLTAIQEVMEGILSLAPKQGGFAVVVNDGVHWLYKLLGVLAMPDNILKLFRILWFDDGHADIFRQLLLPLRILKFLGYAAFSTSCHGACRLSRASTYFRGACPPSRPSNSFPGACRPSHACCRSGWRFWCTVREATIWFAGRIGRKSLLFAGASDSN